MVAIRRCQSKKHTSMGGCGDPRCPEGLSIKQAMATAIKNEDVKSFLEARSLLDAKPIRVVQDAGFAKLYLQSKKNKDFTTVRFPLERPAIKEYIESIDKTVIPSFETLDEFQKYVRELYSPYVSYHVMERSDRYGKGWSSVSVDIRIDADLRSMGIARHIRTMLMKHADEKGIILCGVPTNAGDGSIIHGDENSDEYRQHALAHRQRLIDFYMKTGYEYNYAFAPSDKVDYITHEPYPENREYVDRFTREARNFLADTGFYVRWPKGKIPKGMLNRVRKTV